MAEIGKDTYTTKQAMERLGIRSLSAFHQLQTKYPDVFVLVAERHKSKYFGKAPIDKFAERREILRDLFK